jgi:hypothetical protein
MDWPDLTYMTPPPPCADTGLTSEIQIMHIAARMGVIGAAPNRREVCVIFANITFHVLYDVVLECIGLFKGWLGKRETR